MPKRRGGTGDAPNSEFCVGRETRRIRAPNHTWASGYGLPPQGQNRGVLGLDYCQLEAVVPQGL